MQIKNQHVIKYVPFMHNPKLCFLQIGPESIMLVDWGSTIRNYDGNPGRACIWKLVGYQVKDVKIARGPYVFLDT